MTTNPAARLDPRAQHVHIPAPDGASRLFLRCLPPSSGDTGVLLYVHGATFASALSIAHCFNGQSWRDDLSQAGFHVWALDFQGFGGSDRYPEMAQPAEANPPLGRAATASHQVQAALRCIAERHDRRVSLIAHSWGTMAAGDAAARCPDLVERIVFFAPITWRNASGEAPLLPAWKTVSLRDQWTRFVADTPAGEAPVLLERHLREWGERYLDSDPASRSRSPAAVQVPQGPAQEIAEAWAGQLAYAPHALRALFAIVRGAWDTLCTDQDAAWLFNAVSGTGAKRDIKLSHGGHLMHLEEGRFALHQVTRDVLQAAPIALHYSTAGH